jgi:S1-C subfamily serine protease
MTLAESFAKVRPAVVAFMPVVVPRTINERGEMFPIVGTGVILNDGLVVTNAHVIDPLITCHALPISPKINSHSRQFCFME